MDKNYDQTKESEIYKIWENSGAFSPTTHNSPPFTIIMPPPNANGELHLGHCTFVAVSDILIRFKRMMGFPTLWLPGIDHAGIQTQVTFEKKLKKEQDKSRHDLGRAEFYRQCYEFCMACKKSMEDQFRSLGTSCDWSREKFTLDPNISKLVYETFIKLNNDGLVYRGYRIVNWCPRCRSTLADVELEHREQVDPLYYIKYGPFVLATVRPETKFGDTAVAVNPKDKRYTKYIGQEIEVDGLLGKFKLKVIADNNVDMKFGTGAIKVTPGHDPIDWEIGQKHKLEVKSVIDFDGKLTSIAGPYAGMKVAEARIKVVEDLKAKDLIEKIDEKYSHSVTVCERCNSIIEPLVSRQWFIKIKSLADPAIDAVKKDLVKITPKKYESMYFNWMNNIRDWPISRQIWWGHQLPVWYGRKAQVTGDQVTEWEKLKSGDTRARTDILENPVISIDKPDGDEYIQDPDTFDTWFSSGQWPVNTLFDDKNFYPTSVMNTAYEILLLWVARMIMFGIYLTGKVPFETALINGVLRDETGAKMSKSKGNGVNPNEAVSKYGADAVRMALVAGRDNGNDLLISKLQMEQRIKGYRNFSNKLWNIARFVSIQNSEKSAQNNTDDNEILKKLDLVIKRVTESLNKMRLGEAAEELYQFVWHEVADIYLEKVKVQKANGKTLELVLDTCLRLLHPFMPFVTESIWQELGHKDLLITASWPK